MKAITVLQPFADLICLPDDDDRAKRVENRTWFCSHLGPLLIHAGKGRKYLVYSSKYGMSEKEHVFGALIGISRMVGCVGIGQPRIAHWPKVEEWALRRWPWLATHQHCEGPYGFVLIDVQRFEKPIPYKGAQGLFDVPLTLEEICEKGGNGGPIIPAWTEGDET